MPQQTYTNAQAAPAPHKTAAAVSAASKQQTAEPLLADGRGATPPGGRKDPAVGGSGRGDGEVVAGAAVVGNTGKPLLPEAVVRGLAYGMVNGILLPPVLVR